MYPEEFRYSKDHEWIRADGELGRLGITDYAQKQLGDVVFLELPDVGRTLAAGERFGTVESVKEVNSALASKPEVVNQDPHGEAWMIVVRVADPSSLDGLMDAKSYAAFVEGEGR